MSFFKDDIASMLEIYLRESTELVDLFDKILVNGVNNDNFTREEINELFRTAHSLKSSSAMMGLNDLSTLTHTMEDLFNLFREHLELAKNQVLPYQDLFYDYSDFLKSELEAMSDPSYQPRAAGGLIDRIQKAISALGGKGAPGYGPALAGKGQTAKLSQAGDYSLSQLRAAGIHLLELYFMPDCPMINVRALVIIKQLEKLDDISRIVPDDLQDRASIALLTLQGLKLYFKHEILAEVLDKVVKNSNLERVVCDGKLCKGTIQTVETAPLQAASAVKPSISSGSGAPKAVAAPDKRNDFVSLRWRDLSSLQNLAGEMITNYNLLRNLLTQTGAVPGLDDFAEKYQRLVEGLQETVDHIALLPVANLIPQLTRTVQNMVRAEGKKVNFRVTGAEIAIDRHLFDNITKPLLHMINNAVDHGIEEPKKRLELGKPAVGTVALNIEKKGNMVIFNVRDDGRGVDTAAVLDKARAKGLLHKPIEEYSEEEAVKLILLPGFTTNTKVNSFSGRGVGMDVVNATAEAFGGSVNIETRLDRGTVISLQMPVSVTSVASLSFKVGPGTFFLPQHQVRKVLSVKEAAGQISQAGEQKYLELEEQKLPILDLISLYGCDSSDSSYFLVLQSLQHSLAVEVNQVNDVMPIAEKKIPSFLNRDYQTKTGITGCATLGNGGIGYMLNVERLYDICQEGRGSHGG